MKAKTVYRLVLSYALFYVIIQVFSNPLKAQEFHLNSCPEDITHYWNFKEAGTLFIDTINENNATAIAGYEPSSVPGILNNALSFDGASRVDVPDDNSFDWDASSSFTIEFWMNKSSACPSSSTNDNNVIIGRDDPATNLHWWIGVSCVDAGRINFNLVDTDNDGQNLVGTTDVIDGSWHHIVITRDGTTNETSIYVNGNLDASVTKSYSTGFSSSKEINIGWLNLYGGFYYDGYLDELAVYDRALTEFEIEQHYNSGAGIGYCERRIKVMPLGNSITFDAFSGDARPEGERTGYRQPLWHLIDDDGYMVDFVGNEIAGQDIVPRFDPDNEGHPGWTDDQIAANIYNWLVTAPAEVILLHIGTNGLESDASDVADILDEIDQYEIDYGVEIKVIVAKIINRTTYSGTTTTFNNNLETIVNTRIAAGDNLVLVDMENGAGLIYALEPAGDFRDLLHPSQGGYDKMAQRWYEVLQPVLDDLSNPVPVTGITVNPATLELHAGQEFALNTDIQPANASNKSVSWTSDNELVASVSAGGVVTALAVGTATITATTDDGGFTDDCEVSVSESLLNFGHTAIYGSISTKANRRAQPVTMPEDVTIESISIYHQGGYGDLILAIYNDNGGAPDTRIAVTPQTAIKVTEGWQEVILTTPVMVNGGEQIWLAWVFENNPGIRYDYGSPGRYESGETWSGGMPLNYGSGSQTGYVYSIFAGYVPEPPSTDPPEAPDGLTATATSSSTIQITWYDNSDNEEAFVIERTQNLAVPFTVMDTIPGNTESYVNEDLEELTQYYYRVYAFNAYGNSFYTDVDDATTPEDVGELIIFGNNTVYGSISTKDNRRAQPVTMPENGTVKSLSIYHEGGTGSLLMAIYDDNGGLPGNRIAITPEIAVNSSAGWQELNLILPAMIEAEQQIWLAWVFENNPGIRYTTGNPGRFESGQAWSGGMPLNYGSGSQTSYVYSIYASYTPAPPSTDPPDDPDGLSAIATSSSTIQLTWNDNSNNEDAFVVERTQNLAVPFTVMDTIPGNTESYVDEGLEELTQYYYRVYAFNAYGNSSYTSVAEATTLEDPGILPYVGNIILYGSASTKANRRAQPVTMPEDGSIQSVTIFHEGGTGDLLLAVYDDNGGVPDKRIAATAQTPIDGSAVWQQVNLTNPVMVNSGEQIWLAWVFENNPGIRYDFGSPGRYESGETWSGGMPLNYGSGSQSGYIYSIYANYIPTPLSTDPPVAPDGLTATAMSSSTIQLTWNDNSVAEDSFMIERAQNIAGPFVAINTVTFNTEIYIDHGLEELTQYFYRIKAANIYGSSPYTEIAGATTLEQSPFDFGNTTVFGSTSTKANRRAQHVTMPEDGAVQSVSIYHEGGTGDLIMAIYDDNAGVPDNRIAITAQTAINATEGWQEVNLTVPVMVNGGEQVWLAWVFENNPGIRFDYGSPGRYQSNETWSGGMPLNYGSGSQTGYIYSIYATYMPSALKSSVLAQKENININDFELVIYPNPVTNQELYISMYGGEDETTEIRIYNLMGEELYYKEIITHKSREFITIDDFNVPSGLYLIKVIQPQWNTYRWIVIENN